MSTRNKANSGQIARKLPKKETTMPRVNVFVTVDTEHSIGGAFTDPNLRPVGNEKRIFGKIGNKFYGIPLIMDIADTYNIPLTFFVEVLNTYYFGEDESREVCQYIIDRGHDVQLHLHPTFLNFTRSNPGDRLFSDNMSGYGLEKQIQLIKEGKELLIRHGAKSLIAFRAGNFGADRNTLKALKANGFFIDSSYNIAYKRSARKISDLEINHSTPIEGIREFPITNSVESFPFTSKHYRPMDLNGANSQVMRFVLNQARINGLHDITIILHSFSFIKAYDVQYRKVRPRFHVIRRFENLCRFLYEHSGDYQVLTFGSLDREQLMQMSQETLHSFPKVPVLLSLLRSVEQLKYRLL